MTQQVETILPIPMGAEGAAAYASQLPPWMVLPSHESEFVAVSNGPAFLNDAYDALLADLSMGQPSGRRRASVNGSRRCPISARDNHINSHTTGNRRAQ